LFAPINTPALIGTTLPSPRKSEFCLRREQREAGAELVSNFSYRFLEVAVSSVQLLFLE